MPCTVYCDRAPFAVKQGMSDVQHLVEKCINTHEFIFLDRMYPQRSGPGDDQVALRISKISSMVPLGS